MTLPTEIDQDVKCPECKSAMIPGDWGYLKCPRISAVCGQLVGLHPTHVAALRNQRTPETTEIPNAELERLRRVVADWERCRKNSDDLIDGVRAILAHLPKKKPDHVAVLRDLFESIKKGALLHYRDDVLPALEAAIKLFTKEGKS